MMDLIKILIFLTFLTCGMEKENDFGDKSVQNHLDDEGYASDFVESDSDEDFWEKNEKSRRLDSDSSDKTDFTLHEPLTVQLKSDLDATLTDKSESHANMVVTPSEQAPLSPKYQPLDQNSLLPRRKSPKQQSTRFLLSHTPLILHNGLNPSLRTALNVNPPLSSQGKSSPGSSSQLSQQYLSAGSPTPFPKGRRSPDGGGEIPKGNDPSKPKGNKKRKAEPLVMDLGEEFNWMPLCAFGMCSSALILFELFTPPRK